MTALDVAQGALAFGATCVLSMLGYEFALWMKRQRRRKELSIHEQNQRTEHHLWWHRVKGVENCPWCLEEDQQ